MRSFRDPIHGFIRADALETELIQSSPMQRLRFIRQLGFTFLIFPGAEHSRFSHALGTMHLAGQVYDTLATKSASLDSDPRCPQRRLIRAAALLHDIGHAPYSHSAEGLFEDGIDHEEMTRRLLETDEIREIFRRHGDGLDVASVIRVLAKRGRGFEKVLSEIISSELDVDKMDYLLRDSLYCGVRYGSYDRERLIDTMVPIRDHESPADDWRLGVGRDGVHALEALVMARYYMFTQVYFNVTGKVMELHFSEWLRTEGRKWPADPHGFLAHDDVSILTEMRASSHVHARAIVARQRYRLAFETHEHLSPADEKRFALLVPRLTERFGHEKLLIDHSAKDPHRFAKNRVLVERAIGKPLPMEEVSDFIRHLSRIAVYRVYAEASIREQVGVLLEQWWNES